MPLVYYLRVFHREKGDGRSEAEGKKSQGQKVVRRVDRAEYLKEEDNESSVRGKQLVNHQAEHQWETMVPLTLS